MRTRDRPGPSQYSAGDAVLVVRPTPAGERETYTARVIRTSRTHLHVRFSNGSIGTLTKWDTKLFVTRAK
jgi:hypothetical protein